jgi:hypothetical protein
MRWGHATRMGVMRNAYQILVGNLTEAGHSENLDINRRIMLE